MERLNTNFSKYSTILFIDSMVALEAKPFPTLPWHEIDPSGPILVLVAPQVNTEIDKRKRDGRLGRRAREFNRMIAPAAESASVARISEGPPIVDIGIASCERINWPALDDLDPELGDARLVAQILHARGVPPERKLLFSHDINPIAMAARHGLKARRMPDGWLLASEPSPHEKEIQKLKARVKELESSTPELEINIIYNVDEPFILFLVSPLSHKEISSLVDYVISANPKPVQQGSPLTYPFGYDSSLDQRYQEYCTSTVPRYAAQLHRYLESHYGQVEFTLYVKNVGNIHAENLVVVLQAMSGELRERFVFFPLFGPTSPQPMPRLAMPSWHNFTRNFQRPVGRHEMEVVMPPDRRGKIEVQCADFRQRQEWLFKGIAQIDPHAGSPFEIRVGMTASNLRGLVGTSFNLKYATEGVTPADLISWETRSYRTSFPMRKQVDAALEERNYKWFDLKNEEDGEVDQ